MNTRLLVRIVAFAAAAAVLAVLLFSAEPETETDMEIDTEFDTIEPESKADSVLSSQQGIPTAAVQYYFAEHSTHVRADTSVFAGKAAPERGGRRVVISVCGVDSRVGERVEHADANHVIVVWLDSGIVDVLSIPRGTPANAGARREALNILANVRAYRGRDAYLHEVASIAGVDTVHYYVDFGFSQARGLLEMLGFGSSSGSALKVLRSRQAFASGDYQRSYNQGQFIRQTLLRRFRDLDGLAGSIAVRAGLALVNTNLTADNVEQLAMALRKRGFPAKPSDVQVFLRPDYHAQTAVYDFADSAVLGALLHRINNAATKAGVSPGASDSLMTAFQRGIEALVAKAAADSARPQRVVALLRRPFEQRVWWQINDAYLRQRVRRDMGELLQEAYRKTGQSAAAGAVAQILQSEQQWAQ